MICDSNWNHIINSQVANAICSNVKYEIYNNINCLYNILHSNNIIRNIDFTSKSHM